jgi:hypothetical protein
LSYLHWRDIGHTAPSDKEVISFWKSDGHEYRLSVFHPDTKVKENYLVHLVRLEDQMYMDIISDDQMIGDAKLDAPLGVIPTHVILNVKISGDHLPFAAWKAMRSGNKAPAACWTTGWLKALWW